MDWDNICVVEDTLDAGTSWGELVTDEDTFQYQLRAAGVLCSDPFGTHIPSGGELHVATMNVLDGTANRGKTESDFLRDASLRVRVTSRFSGGEVIADFKYLPLEFRGATPWEARCNLEFQSARLRRENGIHEDWSNDLYVRNFYADSSDRGFGAHEIIASTGIANRNRAFQLMLTTTPESEDQKNPKQFYAATDSQLFPPGRLRHKDCRLARAKQHACKLRAWGKVCRRGYSEKRGAPSVLQMLMNTQGDPICVYSERHPGTQVHTHVQFITSLSVTEFEYNIRENLGHHFPKHTKRTETAKRLCKLPWVRRGEEEAPVRVEAHMTHVTHMLLMVGTKNKHHATKINTLLRLDGSLEDEWTVHPADAQMDDLGEERRAMRTLASTLKVVAAYNETQPFAECVQNVADALTPASATSCAFLENLLSEPMLVALVLLFYGWFEDVEGEAAALDKMLLFVVQMSKTADPRGDAKVRVLLDHMQCECKWLSTVFDCFVAQAACSAEFRECANWMLERMGKTFTFTKPMNTR